MSQVIIHYIHLMSVFHACVGWMVRPNTYETPAPNSLQTPFLIQTQFHHVLLHTIPNWQFSLALANLLFTCTPHFHLKVIQSVLFSHLPMSTTFTAQVALAHLIFEYTLCRLDIFLSLWEKLPLTSAFEPFPWTSYSCSRCFFLCTTYAIQNNTRS